MKEKIKKQVEQWTPEDINKSIKALEELIKEMEEALLSNFEWPSEKQYYEIVLGLIEKEEKRGLFWHIRKRHIENKLRRIANKTPKKLNKESRQLLEEQVRKNKETLEFMRKYKTK